MLIVSIYVRRAQKSLFFTYLMLSIFVLDFAFLFEITAPSFESAFRATQAQYLGGPFTAPLHFLFVLDYCDIKRKWYQTVSLFIVPLVAFLLVFTWPVNGIFYKDLVFVTDSVLPHLKVTGSVFYYIVFSYLILLSLASVVIIMYYFFKRDIIFKKQSAICILATIIPNVGIALNAFGNFDIDMAPMLSGVTCLLFGFNFLKLGFYRITPVARDQIIENMSDGFVLLDMNECFIEANFKAKSIFPQLKSASPGMKARDIAGVFWPDANGIIRHEFVTVEYDGIQRHYQLSQTNIINGNKTIARCIMIYDATDTKKLLDDASSLAKHDTLTGLHNRRALYQKWEKLINTMSNNDTLCLLMIDIDFFKQVNDMHGHLIGDEVLKTISGQLTSHFRKSDIVSRFGGEEFCILLSNVELETAVTLSRSLKAEIAHHKYSSNNGEFNVTISIGIAEFDRIRHSTLDELISDADSALYAAKNSGRNTIYSARQSCEEEIPRAENLILECVLND
jgi:diguanylate cyclase (GGDEF)-like protein